MRVGALIEDQKTGVNAMVTGGPGNVAGNNVTSTVGVDRRSPGFQQSDCARLRSQCWWQSGDAPTMATRCAANGTVAACNSCGRPEDKMLRSAPDANKGGGRVRAPRDCKLTRSAPDSCNNETDQILLLSSTLNK
jgi:hypothetical protein